MKKLNKFRNSNILITCTSVFILSLYCCGSESSHEQEKNESKQDTTVIDNPKNDNLTRLKENKNRGDFEPAGVWDSSNMADSIDFFMDCQDKLDVVVGKIQGVQSKNLYLMGDCFNYTESFKLILDPIEASDNPSAILDKYKKARRMGDYSSFRCFAFTSIKVDEKNPENEFDIYDYDFPFISKAYRFDGERWTFVNAKKITSFSEYGKFKKNIVESK